MKIIWKGRWKGGELTIEAESLKELIASLNELESLGNIEGIFTEADTEIPVIPAVTGCVDAIRELMQTNWATKPRTMNEIMKALEANGLYFSKGTLSGTLTSMARKGELQRVKINGRWKYFRR